MQIGSFNSSSYLSGYNQFYDGVKNDEGSSSFYNSAKEQKKIEEKRDDLKIQEDKPKSQSSNYLLDALI